MQQCSEGCLRLASRSGRDHRVKADYVSALCRNASQMRSARAQSVRVTEMGRWRGPP